MERTQHLSTIPKSCWNFAETKRGLESCVFLDWTSCTLCICKRPNSYPSLNAAFSRLSRIVVENEEPVEVRENSAIMTSARPPSSSYRRRGRAWGSGAGRGRGRTTVRKDERYCDYYQRGDSRQILVKTWKTIMGKARYKLQFCHAQISRDVKILNSLLIISRSMLSFLFSTLSYLDQMRNL